MKIGTRGSDLAMWQARLVRALLHEKAGVEAEIVVIKTTGDADQTTSFDKMEGKGFWTKEIEAALLDGTVDLAVHSLKDLQTTMPDGLTLGAVLNRADRRDMVLMRPESRDDSQFLYLKKGAKVGTTSARRVAQLQYLRPDLDVQPLRGNVPTRVRKAREGNYDAIMIAAAGVERLELPLDGLVVSRLPETVFVPAPGQGALAVQIRDNDAAVEDAVRLIDEEATRQTVWLEREILRQLEGGCQLPLGSAAEATDDGYTLRLFLGRINGQPARRIVLSGQDSGAMADAAVRYLRGQGTPQRPSDRRAHVWLTREPDRAADFANAVNPEAAEVSAIPVFVAVESGDEHKQQDALANLDRYNWIMFTSQVTVSRFKELLVANKQSIPEATKLGAIGRKTAAAMKKEGWRTDFVSTVADAVSLGNEFVSKVTRDHVTILFPCSAKASDDFETTVGGSTMKFERLVCYDTVAHPNLKDTVSALPSPDVVVFTSPSASRFLLDTGAIPDDIVPISIGPSTTRALRERGFSLVWEAVDRSLEGLAEVTNGLLAH
ncbi:MAG: hydroxymethylbilane synthase [candidate division Zixibacteria bacterium]|nr:hydroxymethylbilane synthase [candidate division Zixibacteria bacterium]